jgi:acyl-CoA synthetase (NDP forming)
MTMSSQQEAPGAAPGRDRLRRLFTPRSVAIVGASDRSSWSHRIRGALLNVGYEGEVFFVNPRGGTAHGATAHRSVSEIGQVPDLVYVMTSAEASLAAIAEAARLGTRSAIILSSGFAETGPEGLLAQQRLAEVAREHDMAVLGPNTLGFANPARRVVLMPMQPGDDLEAGAIGVVSQSGNMAVQVMNMARSFDVGLSLLASTGNELNVTATDVLDYLVADEATRVIAVFLEAVTDPAAFRGACLRARDAGKPVVALKVGRSEAAARAALAHTGALVGDDAIISAVLEASGVIRVDSMEDLLTTADTFVRSGPVGGRNLAVVTISGGGCDLAADRADALGLRYPPLREATLERLRELLPSYATPQNPLDATGAAVANAPLFGAAIAAVAADPAVDVTVAIGEIEHHAPESAWGLDSITAMTAAAREAPRPVIFTNTTIHTITPGARAVRHELGVPSVFGGMDRVLAAVAKIADWSAAAVSPAPVSPAGETPARPSPGGSHDPSALTGAWPGPGRSQGPPARAGTWSEADARALLERGGVPVVPAVLASTPEDAAAAAERFGVPVAIKIVSPDIVHKTDAGGVALNHQGREDVIAAARQVLAAARRQIPAPRVDGVLVSPMRPEGPEVHDLLVGVVRDLDWGPVLAVAMGGIWAEVLADVSRVALPCSRAAIESAIRALRGAPVLLGARGLPGVDLERVVDAIAALADLAVSLGEDLVAIEVNPLRVTGDRAEALDATVQWRPPS